MTLDADAIVVGAGLAGLVATAGLAAAGRLVILLDQEPYLGGQAFWSFGGLFLVDSPEQRRMGIRDSYDLALQDWLGSAGFDRPEDYWPRRWAEAYVQFAAGEKRSWLRARGVRLFPLVGWADRGGNGPGAAAAPGRRADRQRRRWSGPAASVRKFDLVRQHWPRRLGEPPRHLLSGVPAHVDGRMLAISGTHGYRALEGTFLGGCLFSGRVAGRSIGNIGTSLSDRINSLPTCGNHRQLHLHHSCSIGRWSRCCARCSSTEVPSWRL